LGWFQLGTDRLTNGSEIDAQTPIDGRQPIEISTEARTILYFDHTAEISGGEIALLHLVTALDQTRFTPVVVLAANGPLRERLESAHIKTIVLPLSSSITQMRKDSLGYKSLLQVGAIARIIAYVFLLRRVMRDTQADLVHTNSLKADIIGGVAARLANVRVLWHVRDRISAEYLPRTVVWVFRRLCRCVPDVIVTNSHATMRTLKPERDEDAPTDSRLGRSECHVVHDGVPMHVAPATEGDLSDGSPHVGLVGRISPWKGQHVFIEAAASVCARFPDARFHIIGAPMFGEEDYAGAVRRQVTELGMADRIEFTGFRTDVPELIDNLDIVVHASTIGEPFGQVVIEGMVAGKPIIATDGGGVPEIVADGVTGLLVPMGSSSALAEAIVSLIERPDLAREMGAAGRKRVLNHFTVEHTARNIETVYDSVLNSAPPVSMMTSKQSQTSS